MKILIPIGDTITTTCGDAVCIEVPKGILCCQDCAFDHSPCGCIACGCIACGPDDRPDGKNVIFTLREGGKA